MNFEPVKHISNPPSEKPLLFFDGDCGFCRRWITRWKSQTGERIDYEPFQSAQERFPEIPLEQCRRSVQLLDCEGNVFVAAEAVFRSLAVLTRYRWMLWLYLYLPGFALFTEMGYRLVARNRNTFDWLMRWVIGPYDNPSTFTLARWVFLRALALIFLAAFISLWVQIDGLIGSGGILPAKNYLQAAASQLGMERFIALPTLCWISASDWFLHTLCAGGVLVSLLLFVNLIPALMVFLCWLFYLSLCTVGQDFLQYQWDILLLEAGLLAVFLAPWQLRPTLRDTQAPSKISIFVFHWLLFRLMFASGVVKLASHDPVWANGTALLYHYFSQPIPNEGAWLIYQMPDWFHILSCILMFIIELGLPFLIFFRGYLRWIAISGLIGLQCLIIATGNYGFFNWLTIALCLLLIEDNYFRRIFPKRWRTLFDAPREIVREGRWKRYPVIGFVIVYVVISASLFDAQLFRRPLPRWLEPAYLSINSFRSVNTYGLFAVMTTDRKEIVVEGSMDGETWQAYEFYWKAGALDRAPRFIGPHMPRLDWQMWFASLGRYDQHSNRWFIQFCSKLLEGSPDVLALLQHNPFPGKPPKYIRAVLYQYEFTDFTTLFSEDRWWKRELKGLYCPVLTLRENASENSV